jgi:hypothetical protein
MGPICNPNMLKVRPKFFGPDSQCQAGLRPILACNNMCLGFTRHISIEHLGSGQAWEKKCSSTFVLPAFKTCCWFNVGPLMVVGLIRFVPTSFRSIHGFEESYYGLRLVTLLRLQYLFPSLLCPIAKSTLLFFYLAVLPSWKEGPWDD